MNKILTILLAVLMLITACSSNKTVLTTEEKLALADQLYAKGKYTRAAELYAQVYLDRISTSSAYALLREADCYFKVNRFADAYAAYQEYIINFPNYPEVSTALFRSAVCLYEQSLAPQFDQTETLSAIEAFEKFKAKYPDDPLCEEADKYIQKAKYKLTEKKFHIGYTYYKMKDYSAALMYFKEIIDEGNTNSLDRQSLYYTTLILHKQKQDDQARIYYNALKAKYPGSKETKKLAKYFQ
ncbi:MAG: outer membrane protein assembly factor BamD [Candidatus Cloacimonadaceae bacterium]|jgi:outer membrane protein assembly factor BamD|nr:outer membrane protein assembly factor BamD [Candidatus Cloacimonadota bacterium]MCB5258491.1 outer membrane protein assembly factor BamD [Candidatus Cloacimonadota bacterium]MDD5624732.1 outer membrane protein assembly factor BamD [Candidatus Cloacimonadota bacterium]MDY0111670.1 outer membrane protein assembly factor BamD [Candidatus Syntrophosphaera sp.]